MTERPTLYYKRGCTSCERARAWLARHGIEVEQREMFKQPLTVSEIEDLIGPRPVSEVLSTRTKAYAANGLNEGTHGEAEVLRLMEQEPRLLRRPLLKLGDELLIGFDQHRWEQAFGAPETIAAQQ